MITQAKVQWDRWIFPKEIRSNRNWRWLCLWCSHHHIELLCRYIVLIESTLNSKQINWIYLRDRRKHFKWSSMFKRSQIRNKMKWNEIKCSNASQRRWVLYLYSGEKETHVQHLFSRHCQSFSLADGMRDIEGECGTIHFSSALTNKCCYFPSDRLTHVC